MDFTRSTSKLKLAAIEAALLISPMTVRELAAFIYASETGLFQYIKYLHSNKNIHISGYRREIKKSYESKLPIWKWGAGQDVPKPAPHKPLDYYQHKAR